MWIVRLALRRPYTFVVVAMLVLILGVFTIFTTPTDIFPNIDIPVISVMFNYPGMSADDMEKHIINNFERIADDDGQRHRAYGEPVALRDRHGQGLFPAEGKDRGRHRPGDRNLPDGHPRHAPGDDSRPWSSSTTRRTFRFSSCHSPATLSPSRACSTRRSTRSGRAW